MKDNFYKIWLVTMAMIAIVLISVFIDSATECQKQGGRYMRGMFTVYECVLTEK